MSRENVEPSQTTPRFDEYVDTIHRLWDAFGQGDYETALSVAHPEIQLQDPAVVTAPGWHHGRAGAAAWTRQLVDVIEDLRIVPVDITPVDDDRVLVIAQVSGRWKGTGLPLDGFIRSIGEDPTWAAVVTMRDAKCWRMEMFDTKAEALDALGLPD